MTDESGTVPRRSASEEEAKALASAMRIRILRLCRKEQLTNKEIATRLAANPATVLYHVRKLVSVGFLEPQEARSGPSGAYEIPYSATDKSWQLNLDGRDLRLRGAAIGAFVSEVGQVPASEQVQISRLGIRLTEEGHARLLERLQALLDEFEAEEPPEGSTHYSLFMAIHPDSPPETQLERQPGNAREANP
ncbi:winged helix-turn-helix domain-containing protein [Arthrobacter sp. zg-Y859]|uniref:Winged helix-turn-helix domain-containing protein n=1 Tax=Arthrobacter jinronghuae TaxID=2964609 RepID=A0ABT1NLT8_9MICC|nr:winged helix-turn-helix domain-containing protein [Arthrobacter jinronghuae]MCQ1948527.1 winged helix-turn-helix domain-containing protein [Arthrobacter jinronghuae]UWX78653.1 winged helix-turn-helix domain-containing protein [Arthrobacter jinronghuae]